MLKVFGANVKISRMESSKEVCALHAIYGEPIARPENRKRSTTRDDG